MSSVIRRMSLAASSETGSNFQVQASGESSSAIGSASGPAS